jgi:hypothetical protein
MEHALAGDAELRRPRPDTSKLLRRRPELKSIVTHPPTLS